MNPLYIVTAPNGSVVYAGDNLDAASFYEPAANQTGPTYTLWVINAARAVWGNNQAGQQGPARPNG